MTDDEYSWVKARWKHRLDDVGALGESTLYVTAEEWKEIKDLDAETALREPLEVKRQRELRETLMTGALGNINATPVVIDAHERNQQLWRAASR